MTLQRDIYVKSLIIDIDSDKGKIDCNGFRIFASEGIFIHSIQMIQIMHLFLEIMAQMVLMVEMVVLLQFK